MITDIVVRKAVILHSEGLRSLKIELHQNEINQINSEIEGISIQDNNIIFPSYNIISEIVASHFFEINKLGNDEDIIDVACKLSEEVKFEELVKTGGRFLSYFDHNRIWSCLHAALFNPQYKTRISRIIREFVSFSNEIPGVIFSEIIDATSGEGKTEHYKNIRSYDAWIEKNINKIQEKLKEFEDFKNDISKELYAYTLRVLINTNVEQAIPSIIKVLSNPVDGIQDYIMWAVFTSKNRKEILCIVDIQLIIFDFLENQAGPWTSVCALESLKENPDNIEKIIKSINNKNIFIIKKISDSYVEWEPFFRSRDLWEEIVLSILKHKDFENAREITHLLSSLTWVTKEFVLQELVSWYLGYGEYMLAKEKFEIDRCDTNLCKTGFDIILQTVLKEALISSDNSYMRYISTVMEHCSNMAPEQYLFPLDWISHRIADEIVIRMLHRMSGWFNNEKIVLPFYVHFIKYVSQIDKYVDTLQRLIIGQWGVDSPVNTIELLEECKKRFQLKGKRLKIINQIIKYISDYVENLKKLPDIKEMSYSSSSKSIFAEAFAKSFEKTWGEIESESLVHFICGESIILRGGNYFMSYRTCDFTSPSPLSRIKSEPIALPRRTQIDPLGYHIEKLQLRK